MSGDVINFKKIRILCSSRENFQIIYKQHFMVTYNYFYVGTMEKQKFRDIKLWNTIGQGENSMVLLLRVYKGIHLFGCLTGYNCCT